MKGLLDRAPNLLPSASILLRQRVGAISACIALATLPASTEHMYLAGPCGTEVLIAVSFPS